MSYCADMRLLRRARATAVSERQYFTVLMRLSSFPSQNQVVVVRILMAAGKNNRRVLDHYWLEVINFFNLRLFRVRSVALFNQSRKGIQESRQFHI